jgi:hypothetical protein
VSDEVELPNEAMERHEKALEAREHARDPHIGRMTLVIILLAMAAAIAGKVSSSAEVDYLRHHIERSDIWNEYQGKATRQAVAEGFAALAATMPNAADPAVQQAIAGFKATAARMASDPKAGNGRAQLAEQAKREEALRDAAAKRLESFELVVSILAIAIGLGSASLLARGQASRRLLGGISMAAGAVATIYGLLVFFAVV